jgi:hypothetical protein
MIFEIQKNGKAAPKPLKTSTLTEEGWNEKDLENYLRDNLPKLISDAFPNSWFNWQRTWSMLGRSH